MQSALRTTLLMSAVLFAAFAGSEAAQAGDGGHGLDIESYVLDGLDEAEDAADAVANDALGDDEDDDEE